MQTPEPKQSLEKVKQIINYPDFLNIQIASFKRFLSYDSNQKIRKFQRDGLTKVFKKHFPYQPYKKHLKISFKKYYLSPPLHSVEYCLERGLTYSVPLNTKFKLTAKKNKKRKKIKEKIFLGYIPYMTPMGSFIFNGYERVIVAQIIKSPGVFFGESSIKNGYKYYYGKIIPKKGIWIEFTADLKNLLNINFDRKKKFLLTTFLRALGYSKDEDILKLFYLSKQIKIVNNIIGKTLASRALTYWFEDFVDENTGAIITLERSKIILERNTIITKPKVETLKKHNINYILIKKKSDFKSEYSIVYNTLKKDPTNSQEEALVYIYQQLKNKNPKDKYTTERLIYKLLFSRNQFIISKSGRRKLNQLLVNPKKSLRISLEDILVIIENVIALYNSKKEFEDPEHLCNKIVNTVGDQLYVQYSLGVEKILSYLKEKVRKKITKKSSINTILKYAKPTRLIKANILINVLNTFFGTNPLSQFMDQMNPLAELTHKRRLSYLGTGGLSRERAGYEIRDINYSYYGRLCPIETPEGPNIGLLSSLSVFGEVNSIGHLVTPYLKIQKGKISKQIIYLNSEEEIGKRICQINKQFDSSNKIICRSNSDYQVIKKDKIDFLDVACNQLASISVSLIPYLEHDDANRALMGSNMMRQAVPLLNPDLPIVYTGMEKDMMKSTRSIIYAPKDGLVKHVSSNQIIIEYKEITNKFVSSNIKSHNLTKFQNTNQNTVLNLNTVVKRGEIIKKGQVLSEGFATKKGELALGKNIKVAFMPFKGYNFEDAIVVSEQIIKEDYFTSIKMLKLTIEARRTKLGKEKLTKKIATRSKPEVKNLDKKGIVKLGTFIKHGSIIVGKITKNTDPDPDPKNTDTKMKPENKLLTAIIGKQTVNVKDTSVRAGPSIKGVVIRRSIFTKSKKNKNKAKIIVNIKKQINYIINLIKSKIKYIKKYFFKIEKLKIKNQITLGRYKIKIPNELKYIFKQYKKEKIRLLNLYLHIKPNIRFGDQLQHGVYKLVKVYLAETRTLKVGDKMSGRHGNKGVVAKIAKEEDMPFLEDGTIIDMVLNPLGVPSRMNLGQIYETITGEIGYKLKKRIKTPIFNGGTIKELLKYCKKAKISKLSKTYLYNGETGEKLKDPTTIGVLYMLKLGHMVDEKLHARSIGPYSLITQQPLGGKSQSGGQRFGEMEVWALEAFGASNILQELLTIKSDDIKGRIKTYEAIVKGLKLPKPNIPEALTVLKNELKGLCISLDLKKY
ncbi:MAG: DNA-directed RNA polymerase subunit beta [Candidatus Karelsulcia muelleri]